jgi:hypothetical protein
LYGPSGQILSIALKVDPSLTTIEEFYEVLSDATVTRETLCMTICTLQIKDINNEAFHIIGSLSTLKAFMNFYMHETPAFIHIEAQNDMYFMPNSTPKIRNVFHAQYGFFSIIISSGRS